MNIDGRYQEWLVKLANIGTRQSFAYGFWSMAFNFIYHSTQVNLEGSNFIILKPMHTFFLIML